MLSNDSYSGREVLGWRREVEVGGRQRREAMATAGNEKQGGLLEEGDSELSIKGGTRNSLVNG